MMIPKRFIAALSVIVLMAACNKDTPAQPELSVDKTTLQVNTAGETITVFITSNVNWSLTLPDWISADKLTGSNNDSIKLTVQPFVSNEERTAAVKLEAVDNNSVPAVIINVLQKKISYVTEWHKTIANFNAVRLNKMVRTSDGGIVVLAPMENVVTDTYDYYLIKLGANGTEQWRTKLFEADMTAAFDGVVIAGHDGKSFIVKNITNDGKTGWQTSITDISNGQVAKAANEYILAGTGNGNLLVKKVNNEGVVGSSNSYAGFNNFDLLNIALAPDGSIGICGWAAEDFLIAKILPDGTISLQKSLPISQNVGVNAMSRTLEGGFIITGAQNLGSRNYDIWAMKLKADGTKDWERNIGSAQFYESASSLMVVKDGYILGGIISGNTTNLQITRLSADGTSVTNKTIDTPSDYVFEKIDLAGIAGDFVVTALVGSEIRVIKMKEQ
jgi:hypothetical protein